MSILRKTLFFTVASIALAPASVLAQTTPVPTDPVSADDSAGTEIIVTATRRNETASRIPLSIVATSQAALDQRGIRDVLDIGRSTPGLQMRQSNQGGINLAIRGVSSGVGAATTAVYINDTPIQVRALGSAGADSAAFPVLFDLQRVEVLRGPQGTLFGAGSQGGTVRFITPDASLKDFSVYSRGELAHTEGGDESYEAGVAVGGPIVTDKAGFRVSAYFRHDGGWVDRRPYNSNLQPEDNANTRDSFVLNGSLNLQLSDAFSLKPSLMYQNVKSEGSPDTWSMLSDYSQHKFITGVSTDDYSHDHFILPSLRAELDLGGARLISSTSYLDRTKNAATDYSAFIAGLISRGASFSVPGYPGYYHVAYTTVKQKSFTQEVRLESQDTGSKFKWVIGGFYQHQRSSSYLTEHGAFFDEAVFALTGRTTVQRYGVPLYLGTESVMTDPRATDTQLAAFGDVDYTPVSWLSLEAGLRFAHTVFKYNEVGDGPLNGGRTTNSGRQVENPVTPKFTVTLRPDSKTIVYGSVAKGFRTGGVSINVPVTTCGADLAALGLTSAPKAYKSDSVWSYEVGVKSRLMGDKVRIAASAFKIDWSNIQQSVGLLCAYSFVTNLSKATSKGADVQIDVQPVRGLNLSFSAAYTDAQYTEPSLGGLTSGGSRTVIVSEGDKLPVAPWQITASGEYSFDVGASSSAYVRGDYNYASSFQASPAPPSASYNPFNYRSPSVQQLNARVGVRFNRTDVSLFVNNVTNSTDIQRRQTIRTSWFNTRDLPLRPRTIGLTASYRY